jgi:hypothetical protein
MEVKMNKQCEHEVKKANSLNEMFAIINKYYNLDKQFGMVAGTLAKGKIISNFDNVINALQIPERKQLTSQPTRNKFF